MHATRRRLRPPLLLVSIDFAAGPAQHRAHAWQLRRQRVSTQQLEDTMAQREQHGKREAKKPKQDKKGGKPVSPLGVGVSYAITTVVPDKGKKKNKG
jgi:hypothetical protein